MLQVSHGTIGRWRAGDHSPLHPATRRQLTVFLRNGAAAEQVRARENETDPYQPFRTEAEDLVPLLGEITRFLGRLGDPGEQQARKLDALQGYKQVLATLGPIPNFWYELREQVEAGEL